MPDASVLLKWALPAIEEPDADKALLLRAAIVDEKVHALVPSLWLYEVGNTIARRFPAQAMAWVSALMKFGLREAAPSYPWMAKTLELAARYQVTFYDAAYHALAMVHQGTFVTADVRYVKKTEDAGHVLALSEWRPPR